MRYDEYAQEQNGGNQQECPRKPKTFFSLEDSDHFLVKRRFVGRRIGVLSHVFGRETKNIGAVAVTTDALLDAVGIEAPADAQPGFLLTGGETDGVCTCH